MSIIRSAQLHAAMVQNPRAGVLRRHNSLQKNANQLGRLEMDRFVPTRFLKVNREQFKCVYQLLTMSKLN